MPQKNRNKRRLGLLIILLGLGFLLYPITSIVYHDVVAERRLASFTEHEEAKPAEEIETILAQAQNYNDRLDGSAAGAVDPFDVKNYATLSPLDYDEDEVFGYLSVPRIAETLPIYLGDVGISPVNRGGSGGRHEYADRRNEYPLGHCRAPRVYDAGVLQEPGSHGGG